MKSNKVLFMCFLSFLLIGMEGCKDDQEEQVEYPEAKIIKELLLAAL